MHVTGADVISVKGASLVFLTGGGGGGGGLQTEQILWGHRGGGYGSMGGVCKAVGWGCGGCGGGGGGGGGDCDMHPGQLLSEHTG